jgi:hypothetical protein
MPFMIVIVVVVEYSPKVSTTTTEGMPMGTTMLAHTTALAQDGKSVFWQ